MYRTYRMRRVGTLALLMALYHVDSLDKSVASTAHDRLREAVAKHDYSLAAHLKAQIPAESIQPPPPPVLAAADQPPPILTPLSTGRRDAVSEYLAKSPGNESQDETWNATAVTGTPLPAILQPSVIAMVNGDNSRGRFPPGCASSDLSTSASARTLAPKSIAAIEWARGVYRDRARQAGGSSKMILLTTANSGFTTFLLAWMCRAYEFGLKFVVHAQDTRLHEMLSTETHRGGKFKGGFSTFYEPWLSGTAAYGEFGENTYLHTSCIKARVLLAVLELAGSSDAAAQHTRQTKKDISGSGRHRNTTGAAKIASGVWFSDPDIAFLRDPTPWFEYGAGCDLQYQINDQNNKPLPEAVGKLIEGSAFNSAGGGNSGFTLWRYSAESLAVARAVADECRRGSTVPTTCKVQYSSDQAVTWVVVTNIVEKKGFSKLGVPLPHLQVMHWPGAASWRLAMPGQKRPRGGSGLGGSGSGIFDICPLPLLTHAIGSYYKHPDTWQKAVAKSGVEVVVAHCHRVVC